MTIKQQIALNKVQEKIKDIRTLLDEVMYYSGPISENELIRIRGVYDLICKANDKL